MGPSYVLDNGSFDVCVIVDVSCRPDEGSSTATDFIILVTAGGAADAGIIKDFAFTSNEKSSTTMDFLPMLSSSACVVVVVVVVDRPNE